VNAVVWGLGVQTLTNISEKFYQKMTWPINIKVILKFPVRLANKIYKYICKYNISNKVCYLSILYIFSTPSSTFYLMFVPVNHIRVLNATVMGFI
jgi:hypothetical protein